MCTEGSTYADTCVFAQLQFLYSLAFGSKGKQVLKENTICSCAENYHLKLTLPDCRESTLIEAAIG